MVPHGKMTLMALLAVDGGPFCLLGIGFPRNIGTDPFSSL